MTRLLLPLLVLGAALAAQDKPAPDLADIAYGDHERHVLDLYRAEGERARPLAVYIHGGGFRGGDKRGVNAGTLTALLDAGVSVAAIHYRLVPEHPLPAAHQDSRRALQFLRSKAEEWNLDPKQVGCFGGSAGAQLCLWLAYSDEMARPSSEDPLERQSTRLTAVAVSGAQANMDFDWWRAHIPGYDKAHRPIAEYFGSEEPASVDRVVRRISALNLVSADDPPTYLTYRMPPDEPIPAGDDAYGWKVHHVNFGLALEEKLEAAGVEAVVDYPGQENRYGSPARFLIRKLTQE